MGIGSDIQPKNSEAPKESPEEPTLSALEDQPAPVEGTVEIPIDRTGKNYPVYEDIFADHKSAFQHLSENSQKKPAVKEQEAQSTQNSFYPSPKETVPKKKRPWLKFTIGIVIVASVAALLIQNYGSLADFFSNSQDLSSDSSQEKGVEIISSQDYTDSSEQQNAESTIPNNTQDTTTEAATVQPQAAPSTTSETATNASVKLRVLNGNGISGSAATIKDILVAAGYTVDKVSNATNFNYTNTTIYYNTGKSAQAESVKKTLSNYTVVLYENPGITKTYDIIVVAGKN